MYLQLLDMNPHELNWLANHLGHDVRTHKSHYRLHSDSIEITKVGRILLAIDGLGVLNAGLLEIPLLLLLLF